MLITNNMLDNEPHLNQNYSFVKTKKKTKPKEKKVVDSPNIHPSCYSKIKRIIDVLGALVGLVITAFLLIPIAIAIKIDDPGPVFFTQTRCGLNEKHFKIWKFRSMFVDAEARKHLIKNKAKGHIFKNEQDPRITRVGKFLRKSSIDEFPQFWNVLKGDMSLVGTRPPTPKEVKYYNDRHLMRLNVKPGLTGEWQVKGRSKVKCFEEVVSMDLDYQKKWSIFYDLVLIFQTIFVVFKRDGAC